MNTEERINHAKAKLRNNPICKIHERIEKEEEKDFVICPVCDGRRTLPSDKFKVWLVWDIFKPDWDVSLRSICTDELTAKKYKEIIEKQHKWFNNKNKFITKIEETHTNHCYGYLSLKRVGEKPNMKVDKT